MMTRTFFARVLRSPLFYCLIAVIAATPAVMVRVFEGALLPLPQGGRILSATRVIWTEDYPDFGGISGLGTLPDGEMVALGDNGTVYQINAERDAAGTLTGLKSRWHSQSFALEDIAPEDEMIDAEGITVGLDGVTYVSWEGHARLTRNEAPVWAQELTHSPMRFRMIRGNRGFEAVTMLDGDTLLMLPEQRPHFMDILLAPEKVDLPRGYIPAMTLSLKQDRLRDGHIRYAGAVPLRTGWRISDADRTEDGVWVLYSRLSATGFSTQVWRYPVEEQVLWNHGMLELDIPHARFGNAEAMEVTQTPDRTRILLVTDNDQSNYRRTVAAEFVLDRTAAPTVQQLLGDFRPDVLSQGWVKGL